MTVADLKIGELGYITDVSSNEIPLKLIEMGCLPGNWIKLVQLAPLSDPLYLNVNGTYLAIRRSTAQHILIELAYE